MQEPCGRPQETSDRIGGISITGSVGAVGGDIVGRDKITYGQNAEELVDVLEARGVVQTADMAGLQRRVIIMLAKRLKPEEKLGFDQALTELERAVEVAIDVLKRRERGRSEDDFVHAVLARVAEKTENDDLDGAAQALDDALAELDRQKTEQQETARRKRIVFLEAAVEQHTLRRDEVAVAARIEMLVAADQPTGRPAWQPGFRARYETLLADGKTKHITFSMLVAIELACRMEATATDEREGAAARMLSLEAHLAYSFELRYSDLEKVLHDLKGDCRKLAVRIALVPLVEDADAWTELRPIVIADLDPNLLDDLKLSDILDKHSECPSYGHPKRRDSALKILNACFPETVMAETRRLALDLARSLTSSNADATPYASALRELQGFASKRHQDDG